MPSYDDEARGLIDSGSYHDGASYANHVYGRGGDGARARAAFESAEAERAGSARRRASTRAMLGGIDDTPFTAEDASAVGSVLFALAAVAALCALGYFALYIAVYAALALAGVFWLWQIVARPNAGALALTVFATAGALFGLSHSGDISLAWMTIPEISVGSAVWDASITRAILFATIGAPLALILMRIMRAPVYKRLRHDLWVAPRRARLKALAASVLPLVMLLPAILWMGTFGYPGVAAPAIQGLTSAEAFLAHLASQPLAVFATGADTFGQALGAGKAPALVLLGVSLGAVTLSLFGATGGRLYRRAMAQNPARAQNELLEHLAQRWISSRDIVEIAMIEKKIGAVYGDLDYPFIFGSTFVQGNQVGWVRTDREGFDMLKEDTEVRDPHHYRMLAAWKRSNPGRIKAMLERALKKEGFKTKPSARENPQIDDVWQAPAAST